MTMSESPENMEIEVPSPQKEEVKGIESRSDEEADDEDEDNDADQSESMIDTVPVSPRFGGETRQRSRKTVDRIGMSPEVKVSKKFRPTPASGSGIKLGEISKIADKLYKVAVKDDALKRLHRILYGSDGTATGRKKEIRLWNGTNDESTKASMMTGLAGAKSVQMLKDICGYLSLATGGDRATLETRIFEFLVHPSGSTDPLKKKTKKRKTEKSGKKKNRVSSSGSSAFSEFLKARMSDVLAKAAGSMSAQNITELLTFEWKNMTESERSEYGTSKTRLNERVHKVISKSPKSEVDNEDTESSSDSSSSSGSSDSDSSSSSASSDESS